MTTAGPGPLRLEPTAERSLRDLLFERGVEFPCGGVSQCGGCKVRVLEGDVPVTDDMRAVLTAAEIAAGWRLGCLAEAASPVTLEIAQWSIDVLDDRAARSVRAGRGTGRRGRCRHHHAGRPARRSQYRIGPERRDGAQPQARFGADLMSRIRHDLAEPGTMTGADPRARSAAMLGRLCEGRPMRRGLPRRQHGDAPFLQRHLRRAAGRRSVPIARARGPVFRGRRAGLGSQAAQARLLPSLRGRLRGQRPARRPGGDGPARIRRARAPCWTWAPTARSPWAMPRRIRCASTAAGPAFEGGRIGMRHACRRTGPSTA